MKIKVMGLVHGELMTHTVRIVSIAKALRKSGNYDIVFSGNGPYMSLVEDAGFDWIQTSTIPTMGSCTCCL